MADKPALKVDEINAAKAPETVDEAEAAKLFKEFSAKHADPYGAGGRGDDDGFDGDDNGKAPAADPKGAKPAANADPAKDTQKPDAAKPAASKDATPAADDIWAKAAKDPNTAALKKAWDEAPESARPAIEAAQRKLLERGQEIHRLRTDRSKPAAATAPAPAEKPAEPAYDPAKDTDWQATLKEYPDALKAVEQMVEKRISAITKGYDAKIADLTAKANVAATVAERVTANDEQTRLAELAPRYAEVREMDGFVDAFSPWLAKQTAETKAMVANNNDGVRDALQIATVFKLFQADTKFGVEAAPEPAKPAATQQPDPAATKRRQQLQGSTTVDTKGSHGTSSTPAEDDEDAWYAHWSSKKRDTGEERRVH